MEKKHPKWTFEEFSAFLMLYAASADLTISEPEVASILEKVDLPTFEKVSAEYHRLSDYQKLELILTYKSTFYPTEEKKKELIELLKEEFLADGKFSLLEKNMLLGLKKLL